MHLDKYIHGVRFTSTRFGNGLIASETNIGLTVRRIILKRVLASRYVENNHLFVYKPDKKFSIHVPGPSSRGLSPQVQGSLSVCFQGDASVSTSLLVYSFVGYSPCINFMITFRSVWLYFPLRYSSLR